MKISKYTVAAFTETYTCDAYIHEASDFVSVVWLNGR